MRTRKHQSPVEAGMVGKHKCENGKRPACEEQATAAKKGMEATNGFNQHDVTENSLNLEQKKSNGKKQKKRRRSPKSKVLVPKVESALAGLMAETVWLDKYLYDEAECAYHCKMAAEQAKAPESSPAAQRETRIRSTDRCSHGNMAACHHVDNGVWLNKFSFDDAESQFVEQFASPLGSRTLNLDLVPHQRRPARATETPPDEGYSSATPTPTTHSRRSVHVAVSEPTVNGKPHWAGVQELLSEVWLDKSLYDQAEKRFYEHVASAPTSQTQPNLHWHSGKKGKQDKYHRKSAGKQQLLLSRKKGLPIIPEETANAIYSPAFFLHGDGEPVWLDKSAYDMAEASFYAAHGVPPPPAAKPSKPGAARAPRPVKCKLQDKKKMAAPCLTTEKIWLDKYKYDDAERQYYERLSNSSSNNPNPEQDDGASTILRDIARARENIQKSLAGSTGAAPGSSGDGTEILSSRIANLEQENQKLHTVVQELHLVITKLESRVSTLEKASTSGNAAPAARMLPALTPGRTLPTPAAPQPKKEEEDDNDIDLFGSDEEEDAEATRIREERLRQYAEKKSKKPGLIAKSSILLDVKPWDDETDMAKLEECVRSVHMDGLLWGSSKLVPVGYGIRKLQIQCVVEDDKVGTDLLEEEITKFEDYVQSVDIAAFNKI